jgi:hypothetical protein
MGLVHYVYDDALSTDTETYSSSESDFESQETGREAGLMRDVEQSEAVEEVTLSDDEAEVEENEEEDENEKSCKKPVERISDKSDLALSPERLLMDSPKLPNPANGAVPKSTILLHGQMMTMLDPAAQSVVNPLGVVFTPESPMLDLKADSSCSSTLNMASVAPTPPENFNPWTWDSNVNASSTSSLSASGDAFPRIPIFHLTHSATATIFKNVASANLPVTQSPAVRSASDVLNKSSDTVDIQVLSAKLSEDTIRIRRLPVPLFPMDQRCIADLVVDKLNKSSLLRDIACRLMESKIRRSKDGNLSLSSGSCNLNFRFEVASSQENDSGFLEFDIVAHFRYGHDCDDTLQVCWISFGVLNGDRAKSGKISFVKCEDDSDGCMREKSALLILAQLELLKFFPGAAEAANNSEESESCKAQVIEGVVDLQKKIVYAEFKGSDRRRNSTVHTNASRDSAPASERLAPNYDLTRFCATGVERSVLKSHYFMSNFFTDGVTTEDLTQWDPSLGRMKHSRAFSIGCCRRCPKNCASRAKHIHNLICDSNPQYCVEARASGIVPSCRMRARVDYLCWLVNRQLQTNLKFEGDRTLLLGDRSRGFVFNRFVPRSIWKVVVAEGHTVECVSLTLPAVQICMEIPDKLESVEACVDHVESCFAVAGSGKHGPKEERGKGDCCGSSTTTVGNTAEQGAAAENVPCSGSGAEMKLCNSSRFETTSQRSSGQFQ